jgi:hypothetical protein
MGCPSQEEYVFYRGEKFQVEFYFTEKGRMPAKEYFYSVDEQVRLKLLYLVKGMAENGKIFDETQFRLVNKRERIFEFKPKAERFFNFFCEGRKIVITNAYHKHGQKVDQRELAKAINFKMDYEFRTKGGIYYENN